MFDDGDADAGLGAFFALASAFFAVAIVVGVAVGAALAQGRSTRASAPAAERPAVLPTTPGLARSEANTVSLQFDVAKADLPANALTQLAPLIANTKNDPNVHINISGYHDTSGNAATNAQLAKQRALAVRDLLLTAGVTQNQIDMAKPRDTIGGGDAQQARRVDVYIP